MVRGARPSVTVRGIVVGLAAAIAGCPVFPDDRCVNGPCAGAVTAGDGGPASAPSDDGDAGIAPDARVDASASARDDDPLLALHVAPQGSDATGTGTRESPFRTIARALAMASGDEVSLHLCAARFDETVVHVESMRRLAITGGYGCPGSSAPWAVGAAGTGETRIVSGETHRFDVRALRLRSLRIEVTSAAATSGASSVAVDARTSAGTEVARAVLVAGDAAAGAPGDANMGAAAVGLDGRAAIGTTGGTAPELSCGANVFTRGGAGGSGSGTATRGGSGATSSGSAGNAGSSGDDVTSRDCSAGGRGPDGHTAPLAGDASDELDAPSFVAAHGRQGNDGAPGQGGGGGGTALARDGAPSGASGGCGGAGGAGGRGGGSSVALVVRGGPLVLTDTELRAGSGGAGGAGGRGSNGAGGGRGVRLGETVTAGPCSSGDGGFGAGGGGGEGGHGGASIGALVLAASRVVVNGDTITTSRESAPSVTLGRAGTGGAAGLGGSGGAAVTPVPGRVGKDGLRQAIRFVTIR